MRTAATAAILDTLGAYESRNVTFRAADGSWPIVWEQARGMYVRDGNGRRYLDLTAAFGVAAAGHANPRVVAAGQRQMATLLHAMGDVHPHARKAELARELSRITFERWSQCVPRNLPPPGAPASLPAVQVEHAHPEPARMPALPEFSAPMPVHRESGRPSDSPQPPHPSPLFTGKSLFCNSGFEAVEAALKTALLATGKPGVLAFESGYHGLGYGALAVTPQDRFRTPFRAQLGTFARFAPYPETPDALGPSLDAVQRRLRRDAIGAVLVEPVQGRGGIRVPPPGFLRGLRDACTARGALLILDEIYTGFGRTGRWFACEHDNVVPDLICLGKGLTGGFPLSACVGRADLMDAAWPASTGEALHTSTYLGHPVGCAMALAQIQEIARRRLVDRSNRLGRRLRSLLEAIPMPAGFRAEIRGLGLMIGLALYDSGGQPAGALVWRLVTGLLQRGVLVLPEGDQGHVLGFTPPLIVTDRQLLDAIHLLEETLANEGHA